MIRALLLIFTLLSTPVLGANLHVRSGGNDSNNGSTWTLAFATVQECEDNMSRGDTCWLGNGSLGSATINVATSGTTLLTFKKATIAEHGSATGWNDAYAAQAVTGGISVQTDYVTIDGVTRDEDDWGDGTAYGINASEIVSIDDFGSVFCADNLTVKYINLGSVTGTSQASSEDIPHVLKGSGFRDDCETWTVQRNYLHNVSHFCLFCANAFDGAVIEYNRFQNGWGKEAIRGQISFSNGTIRFNQFVNACGAAGVDGCTAEIAIWDDCASNSCDGNKIYGNYFFRNNGDENSGGTIVVGGNGGSWAGSPASNTLIYNNTIAGIDGGASGGNILVNGGSGNVCRNNLWYDTSGSSVTCNTTSNNLDAGADPFVNYATGDLHLDANTTAGFSLGSPYNVDMDGVTRSNPDIGAYEYAAGAPADPVRIVIFLSSFAMLFLLGGFLAKTYFNPSRRRPNPRAGVVDQGAA